MFACSIYDVRNSCLFFFHMSGFHLPIEEVLLFFFNDRLLFSMTGNVTMLQGLAGRNANKNIL